MRWKHWLTIVALLVLTSSPELFAQATKTAQVSTRILTNRDILQMVRSGMQSHLIIANIMTSKCNFDVFPPVLLDLKRRGVPENVLHFMSVVPNGPPNLPEAGQPSAESFLRNVKLPQGLPIMVETLYPVSSANFKVNNSIAFSVVSSIFINGVLTIPRGTIARARIVKLQKAKSWGRGGALTFEMERILAIDGTKIPVLLTAAA